MTTSDLDYLNAMNRVSREVALNMKNEISNDWTFAIENLEKVPMGYLQVNEHSIKLAIKNGLRDIPGLQIYKGQRRTK